MLLLFKKHALSLIRKLQVVLLYMYRLRDIHVPLRIIKQVYFSLADSLLSYCVTSWGSMSHSNISALEYLQNKMIRLLHPLQTLPTKDKYKALSILPVKVMYEDRLLLEYYFKPEYRIPEPRNANTRLAQTLTYAKKWTYTRTGERCRSYRVPYLLNSLPARLLHLNSYATLKKELRLYFLSNL